jgi:hypothetical protein
MMSLLANVELRRVKAASGSGTEAVNSDGVDMANRDGVVFFTEFQTPGTNRTLKVQQSSDDGSDDDYTDLTGASAGGGASDAQQAVEVIRPEKRYLRAVATRTSATALGEIWALVYNVRKAPVNNEPSGQSVTTVVSPSEVS